MNVPRRKCLDHVAPSWVKGAPIFFITICARHRKTNQLCHPAVARAVFDATGFYHEAQRWHALLLLLMPDHLHALISFPRQEPMDGVIRAWKHYLAIKHAIEWQRDYFDHRLRTDESLDEKMEYIRHNPVRAGLVEKPEDWPYVWTPEW